MEDAMKKLLLLAAVAGGFVLGSKQGRSPYEHLEARFRQFTGESDVTGAVDNVAAKATDLADHAAGTANEKINDVADSVHENIGKVANAAKRVARSAD
jgi:hypothetical protein